MSLQLGILRDLGHPVPPGATILDLGCGNGALVEEYRKQGYQAYGCDLQFKEGGSVHGLQEKDLIRLIQKHPYRLPFENGTFDLLVSDQVLEHVRDYPETLKEITRVLNPRGVSLHFFPSRYTPIEPHTFVPYGTIMQGYWWLLFWAYLGIRTQKQSGLSAPALARQNFEYLHQRTNYLPKAALMGYFQKAFRHATFCEELFLKYSRRARPLYHLSRPLPFIARLYGTLRQRVVVLKNHCQVYILPVAETLVEFPVLVALS